MNFKKYFLVLFFLGIVVSIYAQKDTFVLRVVDILAQRPQLKLDPSIPLGNLSLQQRSASFYIRNYGVGQVSTISHRGLSAEYIDIRWNGISISSPMHQHSDLSLYAANPANTVSFSECPTSRSGGGQIDIKVSDKQDSVRFSVSSEYFSTNWWINRAFFTEKKGKWEYNFQHNSNFGGNKFYYVNQMGEKIQIQENTSEILDHRAHISYLINTKWRMGLSLWHLSSFRKIPPTMSQNSSTESLQDNAFRVQLNLENQKMTWISSLHLENQEYKNNSIHFQSLHKINSIRNGFDFKDSSLGIFYENRNNFYQINSTSYQNSILFFDMNHSLKFQKRIYLLDFEMILKQIVNSKNVGIPLPTFVLRYSRNSWTQQLMTGINMRLPTTNELYWNPGGNPNLDYEKMYSAEYSFQYLSRNFWIRPSFFISQIRDGIRWQPSVGAIWKPINIAEISNIGSGIDAEYHFKIHSQFKMSAVESFQWIRSIWNGTNSQVYTPSFKNTFTLSVQFYSYKLSLNTNYTHFRYTTTDNSSWLPEYWLMSAQIGKDFRTKIGLFTANIGIENLTNSNYQDIENRAMPLRFYRFQLNYQL